MYFCKSEIKKCSLFCEYLHTWCFVLISTIYVSEYGINSILGSCKTAKNIHLFPKFDSAA